MVLALRQTCGPMVYDKEPRNKPLQSERGSHAVDLFIFLML